MVPVSTTPLKGISVLLLVALVKVSDPKGVSTSVTVSVKSPSHLLILIA